MPPWFGAWPVEVLVARQTGALALFTFVGRARALYAYKGLCGRHLGLRPAGMSPKGTSGPSCSLKTFGF